MKRKKTNMPLLAIIFSLGFLFGCGDGELEDPNLNTDNNTGNVEEDSSNGVPE